MIDFKQETVFKLTPIPLEKVRPEISQFCIAEENVLSAFQTVRDQVVFTNKRIIAVNVQGFSGKKVDFTSIPYSKIVTFSVETAGGMFDVDCELEIIVATLGKLRFEFQKGFEIVKFSKVLGEYVMR